MGQTNGNTRNMDNIVPRTRAYLLHQVMYTEFLPYVYTTAIFRTLRIQYWDLFPQKRKTPPISPLFPTSPWPPPTTGGYSSTPPLISHRVQGHRELPSAVLAILHGPPGRLPQVEPYWH